MFYRAYLFSHVGPQCSSTLKKSLWLPQYSLVFEDLVNRVRLSIRKCSIVYLVILYLVFRCN